MSLTFWIIVLRSAEAPFLPMSRNDEVVLNAPFVYSGLRFPENQMGFREQHDFGEVDDFICDPKVLGELLL